MELCSFKVGEKENRMILYYDEEHATFKTLSSNLNVRWRLVENLATFARLYTTQEKVLGK